MRLRHLIRRYCGLYVCGNGVHCFVWWFRAALVWPTGEDRRGNWGYSLRAVGWRKGFGLLLEVVPLWITLHTPFFKAEAGFVNPN